MAGKANRCREMKPVLHALALDPRIAVADVDILKEGEYISRYQIRLMPTQVFYNAQGMETGRDMGQISAGDILSNLGLAQPNPAPGAVVPKAALYNNIWRAPGCGRRRGWDLRCCEA